MTDHEAELEKVCAFRIADHIISAWDGLKAACQRVETSLPTQLSKNVLDLERQWRVFDELLMKEAVISLTKGKPHD